MSNDIPADLSGQSPVDGPLVNDGGGAAGEGDGQPESVRVLLRVGCCREKPPAPRNLLNVGIIDQQGCYVAAAMNGLTLAVSSKIRAKNGSTGSCLNISRERLVNGG